MTFPLNAKMAGISDADSRSMTNACHPIRSACLATVFLMLSISGRTSAQQGIVSIEEDLRIEAVNIRIENPSADDAVNRRVVDQVRSTLNQFPAERFSRANVDFAMIRAKRVSGVATAEYTVSPSDRGNLVIDVLVTLTDESANASGRGMLVNGWPDFPVVYDANGSYAKLKVEYLGLHYSNTNAWFARPDLMLDGNPMVAGTPAGKGYSDWLEGFVHVGAYGMYPMAPSTYLYAGLSGILSGSTGEELFTNETRTYTGAEDAYVGLITGNTDEAGNRFAFNLVGGRKRFTLGDGYLIINTSMNGNNRAALQSNPRWASDLLLNAAIRYNNTKIEIFRVDPDELPILDTGTVIDGINVESRVLPSLNLAYSYLRVPESTYGYYAPSGQTMTREGLRVNDVRLSWQPYPSGSNGPFINAQYARQTNVNFSMQAIAETVELGWSFAERKWSPVFSYRFAEFSGDNPDTVRFERWDPLLSGGNGEQWVQGINNFKVLQDSNSRAQRFQLRLRPHRKFELVPQFWTFKAPSTTNIGGNPALTFLSGPDLGTEMNVTGKVFLSQNTYIQAHVAVTFPGEAVKQALVSGYDNWWSTMLFIRRAY